MNIYVLVSNRGLNYEGVELKYSGSLEKVIKKKVFWRKYFR